METARKRRAATRLGRWLAALLWLTAVALPAVAEDGKRWRAGAYSFSDELGGFTILSASGVGTRDDPVILTQEFYSASPVTLVIRAEAPIRLYSFDGKFANGFLRLVVVARNASGLAWSEFEFELQETLGQPSVFGDGLSFNQREVGQDSVFSTGFARHQRDFEPYDRLIFTEGTVDPGKQADFGFLISDFTPKLTFFLVQDPRIPLS
jgi:hypothetical protein